MNVINESLNQHYSKDKLISFELVTKVTKPKKKYILDPQILEKKEGSLGSGTTGTVIRAKFKIEMTDRLKEKEFAVKIFSFWKNCLEEFNCHQEIMQRIENSREELFKLNITPGIGIEKKSLYAFCLIENYNSGYIVKNLYDKNLNTAIQERYFENKNLLFLASKHLLEGMLTLMTIGALHFDIKTANILVGRHGKFEIALTDFERISFLQFNDNDDETIKKTFIRIPYLLANENEVSNLMLIKKKEKPAKEFIYNLHKLYAFMLGAVFFEMTTKMSLKKFIILKFFTLYLTENGSTPSSISHFWKKGCEIQDKYLHNLLNDNVIEKEHRMCFFNLINHTNYPDVDLLKSEEMQTGLIDQMLLFEVPQFYAQLVASMLKPDLEERINIQDALKILQNNSFS